MSPTGTTLFRWHDRQLQQLDESDPAPTTILAADSWLVTGGRTLAIELHRERFFRALEEQLPGSRTELGADQFWTETLAAVPRAGAQFPRVELQRHREAPFLTFQQRPAPELALTVTLATHQGPDPRTRPTIKGPDTQALLQARTLAAERGAGEAVVLSPDGFVVEGAYSALLWWRGDTLCAPALELERVDSVTAGTVITLATALGIDVHYESATPSQLDGLEVWALSALHGIRIVTSWVSGPAMAEEPGRLKAWRSRLDRLRRPIGGETQSTPALLG